ncbi:MAG: DHH family phosphoesterase [Candidatus Aenigmarchaeota archaeon]|nr:DHH family phosphoesterase [Candidatus Aenigmarchaeota archaeon]
MKELANLLNIAIEKIKNTNTVIQVVSHLDADGVSAAAIISSVLYQLKKDFQVTFVKMIKPEIADTINEREPKLTIFTDVGSGYIDVLKKIKSDIIILDHHEVEGTPSDNMIHINPLDFDLELSGAGITYLLAKEALKNNTLAPIAVVGTIGDVSYSADLKIFENPFIEIERGLNLFGRYTRPLYKSLEYSGIPGINSSSKALQFMSEIGIETQKNGDWVTLSDLDNDEKKRLTDAIIREGLKSKSFKADSLFSNNLTLKSFQEELRDPKEFATILNACANMNEPATGLALCLGSEKALKEARGVLRGYRRLIGNYMRWVESNPDSIKKTEKADYLIADDNINENLIGTIVSMLFKPKEKTLFGFANAEDGIKISVRSKSFDVQKVVTEAAKICNGRGGGHEFAAGATIPLEEKDKFIEKCESMIK